MQEYLRSCLLSKYKLKLRAIQSRGNCDDRSDFKSDLSNKLLCVLARLHRAVAVNTLTNS